MSEDFVEQDEDVEKIKAIYAEMEAKGLVFKTRAPHQYTTAHCTHSRHFACEVKCPYCRARCDCRCHT